MSILLTYISPVDGGKRDKYHIIVQNNDKKLDIKVKKLTPTRRGSSNRNY